MSLLVIPGRPRSAQLLAVSRMMLSMTALHLQGREIIATVTMADERDHTSHR